MKYRRRRRPGALRRQRALEFFFFFHLLLADRVRNNNNNNNIMRARVLLIIVTCTRAEDIDRRFPESVNRNARIVFPVRSRPRRLIIPIIGKSLPRVLRLWYAHVSYVRA
jgi:hypothetical protein